MSVDVRDLSVSFGGVKALAGLTVGFGPGITGVIGPNGAGKTTLVNALSGFVPVRSGRVTAFGTDLMALAPHRRARWGLRRSFQTEQVVDDLSVADNVRAVLGPLRLSRGEKVAEVAAALAHVGLRNRGETPGAELNGLDRRMTEIAKCLVGRPRLVLLDEPGAGLDHTEAGRLREVIRGIPERFGAMVLLIDHDVALIADVCENTLVLDFGRRIAFGATGAVLREPAVRAAYLGVAG